MNSIYGLDRASVLKRISAFLLDFIIVVIIATGIGAVMSWATKYNEKIDRYEESYQIYENYIKEHDIKMDMTQEEYEALDENTKKDLQEIITEANKNLMVAFNGTLLIVTVGLLVGIFVCEFILPIVFKNGQTIGKKIFSLGLVQKNCVKITNLHLFIRSVLGKYTLEVMVPVYILIWIIFGGAGMFGLVLLIGAALIQLVIMLTTKNRSLIHDLMAATVVVDMTGQKIFESEDELIEFKKQLSKKETQSRTY